MADAKVQSGTIVPAQEAGVGGPSLTVGVYRHLKNRIVTSQLPPGALLQETQIAQELGVSRTPVREALRMLQAEGLVSLVPRRGAQVTQFSRRDLADAYEARIWLETAVAAKAAGAITAAALSELERALDAIPSEPLTHDEAVEAERGDLLFHDLILRATGNNTVRELVSQLRIVIQRAAYFVPPGRHGLSQAEHRAIFEAIKGRDPNGAAKAVQEHIEAARSRMLGE